MSLLERPRECTALRLIPAVGWMGLIFAFSSRSTVPNPPGLAPEFVSNLGHFSVYFVLAILLWWGLGGMGLNGRRRVVLAFAIAVIYGISDEWHQSFVPGRYPDVMDLVVDSLGAACGLLAVEWATRRWPEDRFR